MAHIVPPLGLVISLKSHMEQGLSVQESLEKALERPDDPFTLKMSLWFYYQQNSLDNPVSFSTQYQKNLLQVLIHGLEGGTIFEHLEALQQEMSQEFDRQWKAYLETLPLKLSLPLLLFFFPSYVILLFGPLVVQFLTEVSL